jgi:hypothetical protein
MMEDKMKCWHVTFEVNVTDKLVILITDEPDEANAVRYATEQALKITYTGCLGKVVKVELICTGA